MKRPGTSSPWTLLASMLIATLMGTFGNSIANVTIPFLKEEFMVPLSSAAWVVTVNTLLMAVLMPVMGYLGDLYGQKKLFLLGVSLMGIGALGCSLSTSFPMLIGFRMLHGIGVSPTLPSVMAMVTRSFEPGKRGRALGFWALANGGGHALGPPIGGFLTLHFGWRAALAFSAPLAFLCVLLVWRLAPPDPVSYGRKAFDWKGSLFMTTTAVSLMLAITLSARYGWLEPASLGLWALGLASMALLVFFEKRQASPLVELGLFLNREYTAATVMIAAQFFCLFGMTLALPVFFVDELGLDSQTAGLLVLPMTLLLALFSPPAGRLVDRYGSRKVCTFGMSMVLAGAGILLTVPLQERPFAHWVPFILGLVVIGIGMGLTQSPSAAAVIQVVKPEKVGTASGISHMIRFVSASLGSVIFSLILSAYAGSISTGFHRSLIALVAAAGISLLFALQLPGVLQASKVTNGA